MNPLLISLLLFLFAPIVSLPVRRTTGLTTGRLGFTPPDVEVGANGTFYLLSPENATLFRWSLQLETYLPPFSIGTGALFVALSPNGSRLYIAYENGRFTFLDLAPVTASDHQLPKESYLGIWVLWTQVRYSWGLRPLAIGTFSQPPIRPTISLTRRIRP